jgi:hypothetical protein
MTFPDEGTRVTMMIPIWLIVSNAVGLLASNVTMTVAGHIPAERQHVICVAGR